VQEAGWRFDFMGASRYFFTMSGVILLIGALAVGGRGLNLGIDFTSGSRITASLVQNATQPQVQNVVTAAGASGVTVQKVGDKALARERVPDLVQAVASAAARVGAERAAVALRTALASRETSVGPTFGRLSPTARWSRSSPRCS